MTRLLLTSSAVSGGGRGESTQGIADREPRKLTILTFQSDDVTPCVRDIQYDNINVVLSSALCADDR